MIDEQQYQNLRDYISWTLTTECAYDAAFTKVYSTEDGVLGVHMARLLHAAVGYTTELEELKEPVYAHAYGMKDSAVAYNLTEELGDLIWYTVVGAHAVWDSSKVYLQLVSALKATPPAECYFSSRAADVTRRCIEQQRALMVALLDSLKSAVFYGATTVRDPVGDKTGIRHAFELFSCRWLAGLIQLFTVVGAMLDIPPDELFFDVARKNRIKLEVRKQRNTPGSMEQRDYKAEQEAVQNS